MNLDGASDRFRPLAHVPKADTPPGQGPIAAELESELSTIS